MKSMKSSEIETQRTQSLKQVTMAGGRSDARGTGPGLNRRAGRVSSLALRAGVGERGTISRVFSVFCKEGTVRGRRFGKNERGESGVRNAGRRKTTASPIPLSLIQQHSSVLASRFSSLPLCNLTHRRPPPGTHIPGSQAHACESPLLRSRAATNPPGDARLRLTGSPWCFSSIRYAGYSATYTALTCV